MIWYGVLWDGMLYFKVGSGYSINELKELCRQLHPHWRKFDTNKPPSIIEFPRGYKV